VAVRILNAPHWHFTWEREIHAFHKALAYADSQRNLQDKPELTRGTLASCALHHLPKWEHQRVRALHPSDHAFLLTVAANGHLDNEQHSLRVRQRGPAVFALESGCLTFYFRPISFLEEAALTEEGALSKDLLAQLSHTVPAEDGVAEQSFLLATQRAKALEEMSHRHYSPAGLQSRLYPVFRELMLSAMKAARGKGQ